MPAPVLYTYLTGRHLCSSHGLHVICILRIKCLLHPCHPQLSKLRIMLLPCGLGTSAMCYHEVPLWSLSESVGTCNFRNPQSIRRLQPRHRNPYSVVPFRESKWLLFLWILVLSFLGVPALWVRVGYCFLAFKASKPWMGITSCFTDRVLPCDAGVVVQWSSWSVGRYETWLLEETNYLFLLW